MCTIFSMPMHEGLLGATPMGLDVRKLCCIRITNVHTSLYYSLSGRHCSQTCIMQNFNILCSWAGSVWALLCRKRTNRGTVARDFFCVHMDRNSHSLWNLGDFPNFEKKISVFKKNFFFFFGRLAFSFCHHTHKLHGDNLTPLNLISPSMFWWQKYEGHPINRGNFLIMQEFEPLKHR